MTGQWRARQYQESAGIIIRVDCTLDAATYTAVQSVTSGTEAEMAKDKLVRDIARAKGVYVPRKVALEVMG